MSQTAQSPSENDDMSAMAAASVDLSKSGADVEGAESLF